MFLERKYFLKIWGLASETNIYWQGAAIENASNTVSPEKTHKLLAPKSNLSNWSNSCFKASVWITSRIISVCPIEWLNDGFEHGKAMFKDIDRCFVLEVELLRPSSLSQYIYGTMLREQHQNLGSVCQNLEHLAVRG